MVITTDYSTSRWIMLLIIIITIATVIYIWKNSTRIRYKVNKDDILGMEESIERSLEALRWFIINSYTDINSVTNTLSFIAKWETDGMPSLFLLEDNKGFKVIDKDNNSYWTIGTKEGFYIMKRSSIYLHTFLNEYIFIIAVFILIIAFLSFLFGINLFHILSDFIYWYIINLNNF